LKLKNKHFIIYKKGKDVWMENLGPQNKILIYLGKQHYYSDVQCLILRQVRLLKFFGITNMGQATKQAWIPCI